MIKWGTLLVEIIGAACVFSLWYKILWNKLGKVAHIALLVLSLCSFFISCSVAYTMPVPKRILTVTALGESREKALGSQILWTDFKLDGESVDIPQSLSGSWSWDQDAYCWFESGDERLQEGTTASISCEIPIASKTELVFMGNKSTGVVRVDLDGVATTYDTYANSKNGTQMSLLLPGPNPKQCGQAIFIPALGFLAAIVVLSILTTGITLLGRKMMLMLMPRCIAYGPIQKLLRHQFLFEELVSRDFKKKYKRTVLGMVWSVLSPMLQLLVMWLVFSKFFGRNSAHYVIYIFAGNIVYSYFTDSTNSGMSSLTGNASIFTKVNVPKYLFLFSKNISSLINFSLTIIVFFIFTAFDGIAFTWKFCLLLYPIICLIFFNIGVGLILSALFVFFKDIQYLWRVFTQLLMYMSAIFYTIDKYSYTVQCLFLLNPVYLFIRYFRKIVIEATIPTIWFHLLMAADVVIVLGIGCWMYKKYNHKFLYYV